VLCVCVGRVSKFRHLKGTPLHKSTYIENIRNVGRQLSGECDGFHGKWFVKVPVVHVSMIYIFPTVSTTVVTP